jgi:type IV pilus assembly protein PilC
VLTYKYTARDATSGKKVTAEVQAENEQAAAKLIRGQGLNPLSIEAVSSRGTGLSKLTKHVKNKDRILFSRQLSTLINAGLPLVQSLRSVASQTESKPLKFVVNQVISDIEGGATFSTALAKHPEVFNRVYISLIAAGEASGTLDKSLERLADQQEKDAEIMSKVKGAMVYPLIVLMVMVAVVVFMLVTVLPQVEILYDGLQGAGELPIFTRILLFVSKLIKHYWYFALIALGILGFMTSRWANTLGGKSMIDRLKMKLWPIAPLFMKLYMARFARTGSTLVASGVPLIQMLEITANAVNNVHISDSIDKAIEKVRGGKSLADSIQNDPNFLELVPNMLRIGEQSGSMEQMLEKTATYYEKEVDTQVKAISTIIEPVMMIILGVFALIIVAAILLPIYGLAGKNVF